MPANNMIRRLMTRAFRGPKATPVRNHRGPVGRTIEALEDRLVPAYLFVDFGDNFPSGSLNTTTGALRDVANDAVPGKRILGPELLDSTIATTQTFNGAQTLNIQRQSFSATARANMLADVRRAYLGLNVTVVELTASPQTTADGRSVAGATTMTSVINTLRAGDPASKDCYVFVGKFVVAAGTANAITYDGSNYFGGTSPVNGLDTSDLNAGSNLHDDVGIVCNGDGLYNFNTMNGIGHEAGHCFGLQHAITNDVTNQGANNAAINLLHESELMSYQGVNNTTSSIAFSRYPMIRGDGNSPSSGALVSYNDLQARGGSNKTPFDQLANDANLGPSPVYTFVSGTGAYDIITVTKSGANASVSVQAFGNAAYTQSITVPGVGGFTYTYTIPLTKTILIQAGGSDDRIVIDGDLGVDVLIDGMLGTDSLKVMGKSAALATYTPNTTAPAGVDNNNYNGTSPVTTFGGQIAIGGNTITFLDFETTSRIDVQDVTTLAVAGSAGIDVLTAIVSSGATRVTGTVSGTTLIPIFGTNLSALTVTTNGGGDTLTADYAGGAFPVPITWGAGASNNGTLLVRNQSVTTEIYTFTGVNAGSVDSDASLINYTGVSQITDTGSAADRVFSYATAGGTIAVAAATAGNDRVTSTTGATVTFRNPTTSLAIDANTGANAVTINPLDAGFTGILGVTVTGSAASTITESAAGNLTLAKQVLNAGTGSVLLSTAGASRLTITGTTSVLGGSITLRGGDIDIDPAAIVGNGGTTAVTIRSSLATRPMSIGGTNNAAVAGVNLVSAELARIVTSALGTVTFGDPAQTADITFSGGTTATTPGAATAVVQDPAGAGKIVLDATTGVALNGNGGRVTLSPGLGNISGTLSGTYALISTNGFVGTGLTLNVVLPFVPALGQKITLVNDTGPPITASFANLPPGVVVTASFSGTAYDFVVSNTGGTGNDLALNFALPTTTVVTASTGTAVYGQPVTLTATVTVVGGTTPPTGGVEFFDLTTGVSLGAGIVQSSGSTSKVWTYTTRPTQLRVISPANHLIRAVFTGTVNFGDGTGTLSGGLTVTPAPLTVSGLTVNTKLFDGTTTASLNTAAARLVGVVAGDAVTLNTSGATGTFVQKEVGAGVGVTISGLTLGGANAGNYTLSQPAASGRIAPLVTTRVAVGSTTGGVVSVFDKGTPLALFASPFAGFRGGIAAAMGDLNGDGVSDLVVVKSSGGPAEVKAFDGTNGNQLLNFFAFPAGYTGGASLALADLDGNGRAQIVVGMLTGNSIVAVYDGASGALRTGFVAYPEAKVGVNVAAGVIDESGRDRIVTGANGIAPLVRVFDGTGNRVRQFLAFDPGIASVGVTVGVGDLNSNGEGKILVGTRVGGLDFALLFGGDGSGRIVRELPPALSRIQGNTGGPQLSIADTNGDGLAELLVSTGSVAGTFVGPNLAPLTAAVLDPTFLNGSYIA